KAVFGPYLVRLLSAGCPLVDRLLSALKADNKRTTSGQQADNNQCWYRAGRMLYAIKTLPLFFRYFSDSLFFAPFQGCCCELQKYGFLMIFLLCSHYFCIFAVCIKGVMRAERT
ncbi:MAG: hypothetical protein IKP34_05385, partial [Bacteroidales bacterium]|nr:hypothetical protein [Bacteroidales bacterium]